MTNIFNIFNAKVNGFLNRFNFSFKAFIFNSILLLFFFSLGYKFYESHQIIATIQGNSIRFKDLKKDLKKNDPFFLNFSMKEIRTYIKDKNNLLKILHTYLNHEAIWFQIQDLNYNVLEDASTKTILYFLTLGGYTKEFFHFKSKNEKINKDPKIIFDRDLLNRYRKQMERVSLVEEKANQSSFQLSKYINAMDAEPISREVLVYIKRFHINWTIKNCYNFFIFHLKMENKLNEIRSFTEFISRFESFVKDSLIDFLEYALIGFQNDLHTREIFRRNLLLKEKKYFISAFIQEKKASILENLRKDFLEEKFKEYEHNYDFLFFKDLSLKKEFLIFIQSELLNKELEKRYQDWLKSLWKRYSIYVKDSYFS